jgi:DNA-binding transcriptional LysR family regulator
MNPYNLARFDLVTIRLVVDCARLGSLSAAAEQSHLALAAASRRIRDLEDTLGQQLFERHGRGLHASPAARVFVRHALPMLQSVDRLGGELNDLRRGIARRIRLSASTAAINQFLAPLLAAYDAKAPQVQVELHEQLSSRVNWLCSCRLAIASPAEARWILKRLWAKTGSALKAVPPCSKSNCKPRMRPDSHFGFGCRCAASMPSATWWPPAWAWPCCPKPQPCPWLQA